MTDNNCIGLVLCPKKGRQLRLAYKLEGLLVARNARYEMHIADHRHNVARTVNTLLRNGCKTIVIIGGDTALGEAADCIMQLPDDERQNVALGVLPNGRINDFARFWGIHEGDHERNIDIILRRRLRKVDVGRIDYTNRAERPCQQHFINCVNIGLVAALSNLRIKTRRLLWSRKLSYLIAMVLTVFQRMEYRVALNINGQEIRRKVMTVSCGNASNYGLTPHAVPYNGRLDISIVRPQELIQLLECLHLFLTGKILNHRTIQPYRTQQLQVEKADKAPVSADGQPLRGVKAPYTITIVPEALNFIIPE